MTESELPVGLMEFIRTTLPSYEAAVFLVVVARDPQRDWTTTELAAELGPEAMAYTDLFEKEGFLRRDAMDRVRLDPVSPERRALVAELLYAYDHRPVTLIRIMRSAALAKIRAFSASFRLKQD